MPPPIIDRLAVAGAVGDILLRFLDAEGRPVRTEFDNQVIGLTLEQVRKVPLVIGVAGGLDKTQAITGALRGGLVDAIIGDQDTAVAVLDAGDRRQVPEPNASRLAGAGTLAPKGKGHAL